jgi:hypothetical protein
MKQFTRRVQECSRARQNQIWMLTLYAKNVTDSISAKVLRQIKDAIDA